MNLYEKLNLIAKDCAYIQKDGTNDFHKYKYASAEAVLQKVTESRIRHGVAVVQSTVDAQVLPQEGTAPITLVTLRLVLGDTEDPAQHATFSAVGTGQDKGDKGAMKAMTAAHKYAWAIALGMSWGDDPEADTSTDKAAAGKTPRKEAKPPASQKTIGEAIDTATDVATLKELRAAIISLKGEEGYEDLRAKYKARESSLAAGVA